MGQARPITAEAVDAVLALAEALEEVMADHKVTPIEAANVRRLTSHARVTAKVADHRMRLIRLVTGEVSDPVNIERRFALAGVSSGTLDGPLDAA